VVLLLRFADRIGKGLRTSPRDALIADVTDANKRGAAYGFHRAMDHVGAVIGPLVAAALLEFAGLPLRWVFFLSSIPALAVVLVLWFGVREPPRPRPERSPTPAQGTWTALGPGFRRLLAAVLLFTLGNSADAFLLLRLNEAGISAAGIAVLWAAHHSVKVAANYFGGSLSDRTGPRVMILAGWLVYAAIYLVFGWLDSAPWLAALFLSYGIYFGLVEPAERAWVASLVAPEFRGTAFGWYHCTVGLAALPASVLFGLIWHQFGAAVAFSVGAGLASVAAMLLPRAPQRSQPSLSVEGSP
jgi:MFS family permease